MSRRRTSGRFETWITKHQKELHDTEYAIMGLDIVANVFLPETIMIKATEMMSKQILSRRIRGGLHFLQNFSMDLSSAQGMYQGITSNNKMEASFSAANIAASVFNVFPRSSEIHLKRIGKLYGKDSSNNSLSEQFIASSQRHMNIIGDPLYGVDDTQRQTWLFKVGHGFIKGGIIAGIAASASAFIIGEIDKNSGNQQQGDELMMLGEMGMVSSAFAATSVNWKAFNKTKRDREAFFKQYENLEKSTGSSWTRARFSPRLPLVHTRTAETVEFRESYESFAVGGDSFQNSNEFTDPYDISSS